AHARGRREMQRVPCSWQLFEELHRSNCDFIAGDVVRQRVEIEIADDQTTTAFDDRRREDERRPPTCQLSRREIGKSLLHRVREKLPTLLELHAAIATHEWKDELRHIAQRERSRDRIERVFAIESAVCERRLCE